MQDVPTTTDWLMGICNSRMYFGRADRFTPPVMEGPQRAICGACWKCHGSCDDRLCSGAPPEGMRYNGAQLRTDVKEGKAALSDGSSVGHMMSLSQAYRMVCLAGLPALALRRVDTSPYWQG